MASQWIGTNCPAHCSNTEIPLAERMDCHLLKSFLDIPCKTPSQLIADRLRWNGKNPLRKLKRQQKKHKTSYSNRNAHDLSALQVGNHVAIQNPITKMWDIYGVITARTISTILCQDPEWARAGQKPKILCKRSPVNSGTNRRSLFSHLHTDHF